MHRQDKEYVKKWIREALYQLKAETKGHYLKNINLIKKLILSYQCPLEIVHGKLKPQDHSNMFQLLNQEGTELTLFDLLVAKFKPYGINLRKLWKESRKSYNSFNEFFLDPKYILQVICLIRGTKQGDEWPTCAKQDLKKIPRFYEETKLFRSKKKQFNEDWEESCKCINKTLEQFRAEFGVCNKKYLPYTPMIVTLSAIKWWSSDYDQRYIGTISKKIRMWYWGSIFSLAYSKSTDDVISKHFYHLRQWLAPGKREKTPPELNFKMSRQDIKAMTDKIESSGDARYKAIMSLPFIDNNIKDIYSNEVLVTVRDSLNDHHIFPVAYLKEKYNEKISKEEINQVTNRILITGKTNQEIKKKSPSKYLEGIRKDVLSKYFLFNEIKDEKMDYYEFIEKRRKLIINKIYSFIN